MADGALDAVIEALPLPIVAIDASERIVALNTAATTLLGQGARGRHFITVLRQPTIVAAVEQCLGDDTPREVTYLAADDVTYDVHLARAGDHVMLSFRDVTQMTQAGQMRRDFVANVSHELRTPLTALMGFIETLQGPAKKDTAAQTRFLGIMSAEAERMNRLVGDLLSLSRVEAEERVRPTQRIDLMDVFHITMRNINSLLDKANVDVRFEDTQEPLPVLGDSDQLQQVFTNLLENAVKYGSTGQRIDITATKIAHEPALRCPAACISLRDYGPGIDPQHLPRLTERFYRADTHRNHAEGGTGLGLAIVKHILTRHRGRLKVTSERGQGAEFSVILPLDVGADAG